MKLLRFGFEGEVVPSEVTITQGHHCHPGGLIERIEDSYSKTDNPVYHKWHSDNPGDQGMFPGFRQNYTDLSKWPGAYVFETGREGIAGSKALRGWWFNDGYGITNYDASGRVGQNINVPLLRSLYPIDNYSAMDGGTYSLDILSQCQSMNIKVPASDGLAGTYFFKAAKVFGIDATGLHVPELYGVQGENSVVGDIQNFGGLGDNRAFYSDDASSNAWEAATTRDNFVQYNAMYVKPSDDTYLRSSMGCVGMAIPRPGNTQHSGPYTPTDAQLGPCQSANITASNWNFYSAYENYAAAFMLYASTNDVLTTYGQPSPDNDVVMVDTIDIVVDGTKSTFTLENPINIREWVNVAFKYTRNPNHMFSLQINGQKYEVFGSPGTDDIGSTSLRYISFPLHFEWAYNANTRIPNAIAYDDIAINNNVVKVPGGEPEFSDSDNIIPGFIRCTGLPLTSEVAGNNWNYEGSNGLDTITGQDDVRLYTDTTALNRYRFQNIPATLTGLEAINIGVKNTNISFPSKIKYIGFGLETGGSKLLGDFAASRIGELTNTEGDHSASLIVDPNYPSAFQGLTTSDLSSASIYVEAKKQMGLNFFGLGNFDGANDQNIKGLYLSIGQARNNYTDANYSDPQQQLLDIRHNNTYGGDHHNNNYGGWPQLQGPVPTFNQESATSNVGPVGSRKSNDGDLVFTSTIDPDKMGTSANVLAVPDLGISQYTIIPRHFKNRTAEIHTKNFVISKNTSLNISLGNWRFDDQPETLPRLFTNSRFTEVHGNKSYNEARIFEVDARPNPQYSEFDDWHSNPNGTVSMLNSIQTPLEMRTVETYDSVNRGMYMDAKNYTNQTPSVVVIYAKENIYIDGDVYFDYGDGIHHAPTEHTYHSKDNTFRIIKFSGEKDFDFDVDTLVRSNNTAFSESVYQHHTPTVLDVGDSSIPTDGTVTAIDFSLEAGERQGIVQHGSGGACGDVFGTDSEGRSVHGTNAIGWGCGGGGGLVTGWTDNQGNTLFPMLGLKNTFKSDMPRGLYNIFRAQYGLRSAQFYQDSSTVKTQDSTNYDYTTHPPTGANLFDQNAGNGIPCIQLRGLGPAADYSDLNHEPQFFAGGQEFRTRNAFQWYDASDSSKVLDQRNGWWYKAHHHPVIGQSILGFAGPVPTTTCAFPGEWDANVTIRGDWADFRNSLHINYGYTHHIATALFKDLFVNQNPNEGWRYDSPARTGYAGGPWGGGRGASWTHKKWGDEVLGVHNAQPTFWTTHQYNATALQNWTEGGNQGDGQYLKGFIQQSEFKNSSQYHPDNHAGGYRQTDIYTCPQNIANFGDPEGTSYGFVNYKGTSVGGGSKDSFFAARAYNWQKKDGSKCGSYEWLTNSDYVSDLNVNDIPYLGHFRFLWRNSSLYHGSYDTADIKNPNREVNPKSTSPSLNDNDIIQAWGGSSSLATCGRGGAGGVIVYLIAGGDIVIGPNGKIHARGGHAGGWLDGKYDAPSTITHSHNRFKWCESQARASYAKMAAYGGSTLYRKPGNDQVNGSVYGSQSLGYLGNDYLTINMAGHGGGGGGCITFLHGGLFKNFGTIDVQGAGSEDHQMAASAFWGWTGDGVNPTWGSEDTSGTFQYWSKHNWNYRNFDVLPKAATGARGFDIPENSYTGINAGIEKHDGSKPLNIGYICNPYLENYFGPNSSNWGNDMCQWHTHDLINRGFTGICYPHNPYNGWAYGIYGYAQQYHAAGHNNYLIHHRDNRYNPNYIAGNSTASQFRRIQLPYMITGAGTEISEGYRAEGVPNLCQLQIDETSLKDNPNVVMYPRGGAGAWRNFKIIGNYDNKRSI